MASLYVRLVIEREEPHRVHRYRHPLRHIRMSSMHRVRPERQLRRSLCNVLAGRAATPGRWLLASV